MVATSPENAVELLDRAFNEGDIETIFNWYEDAAFVITEPGKTTPSGSSLLRMIWMRISLIRS